MYLIVNTTNDKICTKWHYMNDNVEHVCWKTADEIEKAHSYRNDTTEIMKFYSKAGAQDYIETECDDQENLMIATTSYIQHVIEDFKVKFMKLFKNEDSNHHISSCC